MLHKRRLRVEIKLLLSLLQTPFINRGVYASSSSQLLGGRGCSSLSNLLAAQQIGVNQVLSCK